MFFIEDKDFLKDRDKDYIKNAILTNFPFYLQSTTVGEDKNPHFSHILLTREEERPPLDGTKRYPWNSDHGGWAKGILDKFCEKNNIKYDRILRSVLNITFNTGIDENSPAHRDHKIPHKQFILYLNDADPKSKTVFRDDDGKICKEITPGEHKGIMIDSGEHYYFFPKTGYRAVLVMTLV